MTELKQSLNPISPFECKKCGRTGEEKFSWNGECLGCEDDGDYEKTPICKVTGTHCTGRFCDEYGCAKEAGFYDDEH